jgi:hypothetical protein
VYLSGLGQAQTITDGFSDADRNNDGTIGFYDTDADLNDTFDAGELQAAQDVNDTGIIWAATRGFTGANDGDPKPNLKVREDATSPGSSYVLGVESKGSGSSFAGYFDDSLALGPNVGDKIVVEVDFRFWIDSPNPTPAPGSGELRWGIFQDTDAQFGQSNSVGRDEGAGNTTVVWGDDTGFNDGLWRGADPGPIGDKSFWARMPLGPSSNPEDARIVYERATGNFMEGSSVANGGDTETIASPTDDGPGGRIADLNWHTLGLHVVRTVDSVEVASFIDGTEILRDNVDPADEDVIFLGAPPTSFDYIAFRNATGDYDYLIDSVRVMTMPIPEPATAWLLVVGATAVASGFRHRRESRPKERINK